MAKTIFIIILSLSFLDKPWARSKEESPQFSFEKGLEQVSDQNYTDAIKFFDQALYLEPSNPDIAYNLGVAYLYEKQFGPAIAYLRYAIHLSPLFGSARNALEKAYELSNTQTASEDLTEFEVLREYLLGRWPRTVFIFLLCFSFLFSGWFLITWLGNRKKAKIDELEAPPFPPIAGALIAFFILTLVLAGLKFVDGASDRGSILPKEVDLRSGPSEDFPKIAQIFEGFDVIIKRKQKDWVQIVHPGGYSGWVPKNSLLEYSNRGSHRELYLGKYTKEE